MTYKCLTLDGGGSWALIEVRTLIKLYGPEACGHDVLRTFDLVAANSGGSLVLAGLVENLPLKDIAQYFLDEQKRRSIFSPTTSIGDEILQHTLGIGPKYSARAKLPAIERLLPKTGNSPLANLADGVTGPGGKPVHLLIVGFDYDRNRAVFFRSAKADGLGLGYGQPATVTLAGAVHASTNAPVAFFDAPAVMPNGPGRFWDGGVTGCNNPAVVAVVEAMVLGKDATSIRLLSLGTGAVSRPIATPGAAPTPFEVQPDTSSLLNDLKKLAGAITDDPPDAATFIAHVVTGGPTGMTAPAVSRVVRMSPLISPLRVAGGGWRAPDDWSPAQFDYLCGIGMDALTANDIAYIDDYCQAWLDDRAPNQPIRPNGSEFDPETPEIGYAWFTKAHAAWLHLVEAQAMA